MDPSRVMYNALVPFLVASLEHFFRETFEVLLKYDEKAQTRLSTRNRKVSFSEARAVGNGELSLERVASGWFSFQNLDSIQKAFKEVHSIDVLKVLRRRKRVRDRLPLLMNALQNLIGPRHKIVHHFSVDRNLDRDGFLDLLDLVRAVVDVMGDEIGRNLNVPIGPG